MNTTNKIPGEGNELFPVFFKLNQLRLLVVGGGNVGMEKLRAVIHNSPGTAVKLVSLTISEEIKGLARQYSNIILQQKPYHITDLEDADLVIAAVNDIPTSEIIRNDAKKKGKLINVADMPELCDFYLSSIVKKGNIKIAISTNGKSPTIAKRLKEVISQMIPGEMEDVLDNMEKLRDKMTGDFQAKVKELNALTKLLVASHADVKPSGNPAKNPKAKRG